MNAHRSTHARPDPAAIERRLRIREETSAGRGVVAYLAVAYALSWSWSFALVATGLVVERGEGWPTHAPALAGPAIAALLACVLMRDRRRLAGLAAGLTRWRLPVRWWAAALSPLAFLAVALASYRGFGASQLIGFLIGITAGSVVLTWLYNGSGGSILAVAAWHTLYNLTTATTAGNGLIAAVVSTIVIVLAVVLVRHELRARHQGERSLLGPPPPRREGRHHFHSAGAHA